MSEYVWVAVCAAIATLIVRRLAVGWWKRCQVHALEHLPKVEPGFDWRGSAAVARDGSWRFEFEGTYPADCMLTARRGDKSMRILCQMDFDEGKTLIDLDLRNIREWDVPGGVAPLTGREAIDLVRAAVRALHDRGWRTSVY